MKKSASEKPAMPKHSESRGLLLLGISLFLLLSLLSFHIDEPDKNWLGFVGWGVGFAFSWALGLCSYGLIIFFGIFWLAIPFMPPYPFTQR